MDARVADVGVDPVGADLVDPDGAQAVLLSRLARLRNAEVERGITLTGPHRDDLQLILGTQPAKGFASHGESWSFALTLRLASHRMQRADGTEPLVILDDVFAELDRARRRALVDLAGEAEQVLITAAVDEDIPADLREIAQVHAVRAHMTDDGRVSELDPADD